MLNKRIIILILGVLLMQVSVFAQTTMTDEQVMDFVIKENEKGTSREEIVTKLTQRGVSMQQLQRIRSQYEKEKNGAVMGAKDLTGSQSRLRENNGDKKKTTDQNFKHRSDKDRQKGEYASMTERERQRLEDENSYAMLSELDYILPDSLAFWQYEDETTPKKKVFGHNIFNQQNLSFEPNMNIATPADYCLGPGDVVFVDIWGASQKTLSSTVSPEGEIEIEGYGPFSVNGLTVSAANSKLRSTVGQRFGGSQIKLSVGQTRTIGVNVMGEVVAPGTYTLSAFATVFHALYMAGGVNEIGTLRDIKVYRKGRLISTIDIYDYILNGNLSGNVRLASEDVIIVGPYDCLVNITGKVKRPMYYEMTKKESVATLIKYAGGFTGDAYEGNVRLIRKRGGEMSIYSLDEFERGTFQLEDGDSLSIDSVLPRFRNMVEVKGAVYRPGMYQMDGNINTVRQLLEVVGGVTEDAFLARAVMHRRKADRTLEVLSIDIEGLMSQNVPDVTLRNEDVLFIPSLKDVQEERTLSIFGEVNDPGVYQFAEKTTLEDFILQAGGLKDGASLVKIDVSRRLRDGKAMESGNLMAKSYTFSIKDGFVIDGTPGFELEPFDEVFVRKSPGYVEQKHVSIEGEIVFGGKYVMTQKKMRLSDLVKSAGGLTLEAYPQGARLERTLTTMEKINTKQLLKLATFGDSTDVRKLDVGETRYVGINLDKALQNPGNDEWDIVLEEGDKLSIPSVSNTVSINGEVMYPNTVAYKQGADLDYYVNMAGGYSLKAKKRRVFAVNMNGTVTRVKSSKDIQPGCEIVVPVKKKNHSVSLAEIISLGVMTSTMLTAIVTLIRK